MIYIPEHSVEITISAKVFENGKLINVEKVLTMGEVGDAIEDARLNYIEDDDKFVLTEKGRQWLEELKENE